MGRGRRERAWIEDDKDEDGGEMNKWLRTRDAGTYTVHVLKYS